MVQYVVEVVGKHNITSSGHIELLISHFLSVKSKKLTNNSMLSKSPRIGFSIRLLVRSFITKIDMQQTSLVESIQFRTRNLAGVNTSMGRVDELRHVFPRQSELKI